MAPIDITQAQSQARAAVEPGDGRGHAPDDRAGAEAADRRRHRRSGGMRRSIRWTAPTSSPRRSTSAAVKRALENRTDLQQTRKNLAVNDVTLNFLRNQTLPQADVVARYGLIGRGRHAVHHHRLGHQPPGDRRNSRRGITTRCPRCSMNFPHLERLAQPQLSDRQQLRRCHGGARARPAASG